ncbi:UDP-N-acetylmuramate dehydrogenase [Orbus hercynius]|uniref:UDP-N-acetylenolpyruvoylglucosamine reductase n=1 Tax=Orbus hercynius TaxID=593135 RepID=A0A495RI56_9GAMM|nr:UDP-N-acetylmuramate dehydrogenase [Orbus hercynius]RKS86954.1 UDP-N-acetylmuramate dehydrogenase [Orbus hercynius]
MKKRIPNTFNLPVYAQDVIAVNHVDELMACYEHATAKNIPMLVLGEGSNTLFTEDFAGMVILNRIGGVAISETEDCWLIKAGAGVIWHQLVSQLIEQHIPGLENLALIPGCVGSAPIQNIGAYGVEFEQFADYVELLDLTNGELITVTDGEYGYRESIFKSQYRQHYVVTAVGVKLPKQWQPVLSYGELKLFDRQTVTAKMIFDKVCEVRSSKLPNPKVLGNGGSFFKNPVIDRTQYQQLAKRYPDMPAYFQADGQVKLAAGWLIDQCGLKNHQIGGAAVHDKQALVLINKDHAIAQDVIDLARVVRNTVQQRFGISLSPEIRFIAKQGEIDANLLLS